MKSGNIARIIFWGLIGTILLAVGFYGLFLYNSGHGTYGKIIKETSSLVQTYNNLSDIKKFNNSGVKIVAKSYKDTIQVDYVGSVSTLCTFKYDDNSGKRLLTTEYGSVAEGVDVTELIVKYMIEAVSVSRGYKEGETFTKFQMSDFLETNPTDGISIRINNGITKVIINMDTSILDSNIESSEIIEYLTLDKAKELIPINKEKGNVTTKTKNLTIHLTIFDDNNYTIYIRDDNEIYSKGMYESVKSIIEAMSGTNILNEFTTICPSFNNENYENENSNIKITYDTTNANAYTEFAGTNKILQIDVKYIEREDNTEVSQQ